MTNNDIVELISVADGRDGDIAVAVDAIGLGRTVDILMNEITFRFEPPRTITTTDTEVQFTFSNGEDEIACVVTATPHGASYALGRAENPDARVEQELTEVLRMVFGSTETRQPSTRRVELREAHTVEAFIQPPATFAVVERLLATMDERGSVSVTELASRYGSDKWGIHSYARHYQRHFEPLRNRFLTVLEIGVGGFGVDGFADPTKGGASLRMWKRFFPRALVYGADIADKSQLTEQRIGIAQVDQSDPSALLELADAIGPFDIVIDDGSHINRHVLTSFETLFPHLRNGGLYVIEDVQTSYWPPFGGDSRDLSNVATSVGFLKTLVDGLNHEEIMGDTSREPRSFDGSIQGLHFYHNIAFIEKGLNAEGGGPDWVRGVSRS